MTGKNYSADYSEFPMKIFGSSPSRRPPAVKHLVLQGFDIASSLNTLPLSVSLRTLHITAQFGATRPSSQSFLKAMQSSPLLETMIFQDILPCEGLPLLAAKRGHLSTFPNITLLKLSDQGGMVIDFLLNFRFPTCRHLSLSLRNSPGDLAATSLRSVDQILVYIETFIENHRSLTPSQSGCQAYIADLKIQNTNRSAGTYAFTFQTGQQGGGRNNVCVDINLENCMLLDLDIIFPTMCNRVDMLGLQLLVLSECHEISESDWKRSFAPLPNLKTVHFMQSPFSRFVGVMKQDPSLPKRVSKSSHVAASPSPTFFASLTTVKFTQVKFQKQLTSQLGQCLKRRPKSWPSIEIQIEDCTAFQHFETLHKAALNAKVLWNADLVEQISAR
ncbi:hypothetical protein NMY22_g4321 [Coprinellus aureogranulatus]|nr:hypothetical protein NMY22_g4321 [Coprinellus aureogranulatus]